MTSEYHVHVLQVRGKVTEGHVARSTYSEKAASVQELNQSILRIGSKILLQLSLLLLLLFSV